MPFYFNGTLIPENVASAFTFNGTNITDVFMNGVQVWDQVLFSGVWSGSSIVPSNAIGIETTGSAYRAVTNWSGIKYGIYLYADTNGLANGTSLADGQYVDYGFTTTTTTFAFRVNSTNYSGITFAIGVGFTGTAYSGGTFGYETNSGLIRASDGSGNYGAWISLT